jgi:hypothetical protein
VLVLVLMLVPVLVLVLMLVTQKLQLQRKSCQEPVDERAAATSPLPSQATAASHAAQTNGSCFTTGCTSNSSFLARCRSNQQPLHILLLKQEGTPTLEQAMRGEKLEKKKLPVSVHSNPYYHVSCCCTGLLAYAQQNRICTPSCGR